MFPYLARFESTVWFILEPPRLDANLGRTKFALSGVQIALRNTVENRQIKTERYNLLT